MPSSNPPHTPPSVKVQVRLPTATYEQLVDRAGVLTVSDVLRLAIDQYLHAPIIAPNGAFVDTREKRG